MRLEFIAKGSEEASGGSKEEKAGLKILSGDQLKELQQIQLMILDDIIAICRRYQISYMLIAGSAIGALRGGEFIPWDDDIGIALPRREFEKFVRVVRKHWSDKYSVIHRQDPDNEGRLIPKLRLKGTEYRTFLEWDLKESGIFIDIFTFENIPDNALLRKIHGILCNGFGFALSVRRLYRGRKHYVKIYNSPSFYAKCALGALLSFASIEKWTQWTDFWYSACRNTKTRDVSCPTDTFHYFGEIYERAGIEETYEVPFSGRMCAVSRDVDGYLRHRYGDYMQVPPESGRMRNWYLTYDPGIYGKKERADV